MPQDPTPEEVTAYAEWLESAGRIADALAKAINARTGWGTTIGVSMVDYRNTALGCACYEIVAVDRMGGATRRKILTEADFLSRTTTKKDYLDLVAELASDLDNPLKERPQGVPVGWYNAQGTVVGPLSAQMATYTDRLNGPRVLGRGDVLQCRMEDVELERASEAAISSIFAAHEAQAHRASQETAESPSPDSE